MLTDNLPVVRVLLDTCCSLVPCDAASAVGVEEIEDRSSMFFMVRFLSVSPTLEGSDEVMG